MLTFSLRTRQATTQFSSISWYLSSSNSSEVQDKNSIFKHSHFPREDSRFFFHAASLMHSVSTAWIIPPVQRKTAFSNKQSSSGNAEFSNPRPVLKDIFIKRKHWFTLGEGNNRGDVCLRDRSVFPPCELCHLNCLSKVLCLSLTKLLRIPKNTKEEVKSFLLFKSFAYTGCSERLH